MGGGIQRNRWRVNKRVNRAIPITKYNRAEIEKFKIKAKLIQEYLAGKITKEDLIKNGFTKGDISDLNLNRKGKTA